MDLHFEVEGRGQPVIILHGLFGSLDNWRSISGKLADRFKVFLLDQRNHGRSPHSDQMDYRLMASDVRQLLERQGMGSAHVLGHSMGGKTAMQLALLHPENVSKLIVADMAPRAYAPRHQKLIDAMLALDLTRFQTRREIEIALAPSVADLATRQFLLKNVVRLEDGGFTWRLGLEQIKRNYPCLTQALTSNQPFDKPALFIRGANSDYLVETDFPAIERLFPKAVLKSIDGAGHLLHVQRPEVFSQMVTDFFAAPSTILR